MNTYTIKFNGFYPVGAVALVVAETVDMAVILINKELRDMGLKEVTSKNVKQQDNTTRRVDILLDGDY